MTTEMYQPISCDYHDRLEALAIKRQSIVIQFRETDGKVQTRDAIVTDVYARSGADYLTLSTGETIRLDQLIEVDGAKFSAS
ncbi:hypothetical protein [Duganella callida]|uniref:Rho-binding antiterminator n=1 Tax=Duganella callida TaxID=2561932 RepID=A0A4Y9SF97_9BURK|nr:hypothetical protein [Duganella callida]TFW18641.1 hypothetical protein E4L98_17475 [Duganella callida]